MAIHTVVPKYPIICFTVFVITNSVWQLRRIKAEVRVLPFDGCSNFPFNSTFTTSRCIGFWAADWIGLKASSRDTSVTYIGQRWCTECCVLSP